jgi:aspartate/methionine/tyrosine aminotransferase
MSLTPVRRLPAALAAAALEEYAADYGASVYDLDRELGQVAGPPGTIDLTHGDTRAFLPPTYAVADLETAVRVNDEAYTAYRGSESLRLALAPRLARLLERDVDPARELIITPGTQGGLFAALSSLVGPGDVVALPDPDYFMSERIVAYLGARAVRLPLTVAHDGRLSVETSALSNAGEATLLLFSHPNNPTGGVYDDATLRAFAEFAVAGDRFAIVDQLYCRQLFSGAAFQHLTAFPGMAERSVTLVGPSKTESMSGFRVGAAVGPAAVVDSMERVLAMASLRAAGYAQQTLRHWLDSDGEWIAQRAADHQRLRDELLSWLRAVEGVAVPSPLGSSYVFVDAGQTAWANAHPTPRGNALAIALKSAGVLINPGYQFGLGAPLSFRINFSQDRARLAEAAARIASVLGGEQG